MNADFSSALVQARQEGKAGLQRLAEEHLPLVGAMVRRMPSSPWTKEELYQQGVVGLMKALSRFDPAKGTTFSTYAAAMILGEMRMLHRMDAPLHIPRTEAALRRRIHQAESELTRTLRREPTVTELADTLHMDAAELILHMDVITVASTDAASPGGTALGELLPDPDDWQQRIELQDILHRLPRADQQLILLRFRLGMTQTEAGKRLGLTQMQISRRERIIRTLLKRALAN